MNFVQSDQLLPHRLLVIDHKPEVTLIVAWLVPALRQGNELVAQVNEGHGVTFAAQREFEKLTIERQRFLDITNLQRYVIDANRAGSLA